VPWPASAAPPRTGRGWHPVPPGRGLPQRPGPDPLMPASPGSPYTAATNRVHPRHRAQLHHSRSRSSLGSCPGSKARFQDDSDRTHCHAADRVLIGRRDAGTPSIVHAARAHRPLAVKLIAGRGAGDERRRPRPGRPGAVDVPGVHSGQAPNPGTSSRTAGDAGPGSSSGPGPVRRPGPGNVTAEPAGRGSVRRDAGGRGCPERPHPIPESH